MNGCIYVLPGCPQIEIPCICHDAPQVWHPASFDVPGCRQRFRLMSIPVMYMLTPKFCAQNSLAPLWPYKPIILDFIMELPESNGYSTILTVVDQQTKMMHFIPWVQLPRATVTALLLFAHIFYLHGLPNCITSDKVPVHLPICSSPILAWDLPAI